jgi:AraC-like DNA-binding protein
VADPVVESITRPPAGPLAPFVERYHGYRIVGAPPGIHRGLPSRHLTFIVSIGPPIDVVAQTDPGQSPARYGCVVGGLQSTPALIAHDGNQEGVTIALTPTGSRALLGRPARDLWNISAEIDDVVGPVGSELWERLQGTTTWDERLAVCDTLLGRLLRDDPVAPELDLAWRRLVRSGGNAPVSDLAGAVGWTRQHFARRFGDEFGLAPKLAGRIVRFERARRLVQSTPPYASVAQVAAVCGYYDQAHLNRDFAELAGCSPVQLRTGDLPSVQDPEPADAPR